MRVDAVRRLARFVHVRAITILRIAMFEPGRLIAPRLIVDSIKSIALQDKKPIREIKIDEVMSADPRHLPRLRQVDANFVIEVRSLAN